MRTVTEAELAAEWNDHRLMALIPDGKSASAGAADHYANSYALMHHGMNAELDEDVIVSRPDGDCQVRLWRMVPAAGSHLS